MLEVRRLRMLYELNRRGTIAAVAAALHQSPSSISQGLSLLEREVGVRLMRRVGRQLELTQAGLLLAEHAGRILSNLAEAKAAVHHLDGAVTGQVRIAAFQSASFALMPQMLAFTAKSHPRLRVTVVQRAPAQALRGLHSGDFDMAVIEEYPDAALDLAPDINRVHLGEDQLYLALPATSDSWNEVTCIAEARELPWVLEPEGTESCAFARRVCHEAGFEPDIRFEVDDLETQLSLIEGGHAVAILPDLMLAPRERNVRLVPLPKKPRRSFFTLTRHSLAPSAAVQVCREALADVVNSAASDPEEKRGPEDSESPETLEALETPEAPEDEKSSEDLG